MYQQPNHSYHSTDSLRRLSSNNPFRNISNSSSNSNGNSDSRFTNSNGTNLVKLPNSKNFENWVAKNKKLIYDHDESQDFDDHNNEDFDDNYGNYLLLDDDEKIAKPQFPPKPMRSNSDSSVKMSSNNPFAKVLNDDYVAGHTEASPIPNQPPSSKPPTRPKKVNLPPPSYEEAAGREAAARKDYPREKSSSSSSSRSTSDREREHKEHKEHREHRDRTRSHRSHSDSNNGGRDRSDRDRVRSHRSRSDRERSDKKSSSKSKKAEATKSKNLDTIDKLDVTAFFGSGFHHDGPFDACAPHRNKNVKAAPVMAFPVDGPNNSIKGLSNIDKNEQINLAFGNYSEDQNEIIGRKISIKKKLTSKSSDDLPYGNSNSKTIKSNGYSYNNEGFTSDEHVSSMYVPKENPSVINFDANLKSEPIHGISTAGLGSSTFLDGAPAPKQDEYLSASNGGLGRKKSLVQRLRKNSGGDNLSARNSNDYLESNNSHNSFEGAGNSLIRRVKSLKVGRRER